MSNRRTHFWKNLKKSKRQHKNIFKNHKSLLYWFTDDECNWMNLNYSEKEVIILVCSSRKHPYIQIVQKWAIAWVGKSRILVRLECRTGYFWAKMTDFIKLFCLEWLKLFWYLIIRENPEWRNSINAILKQSNNQWLRSVLNPKGFREMFMVFVHSILIMILGNIFIGI